MTVCNISEGTYRIYIGGNACSTLLLLSHRGFHGAQEIRGEIYLQPGERVSLGGRPTHTHTHTVENKPINSLPMTTATDVESNFSQLFPNPITVQLIWSRTVVKSYMYRYAT